MTYSTDISDLQAALVECDSIFIGAGAGLSTSAGFAYSGEFFEKYFFDFHKTFGVEDMYSGGFYPFPNSRVKWAWWGRVIWLNRFVAAPKNTYPTLLNAVKNKDYFVITTNVNHQFQIAGFDKSRLFYTQGDYGLLQCSKPCHQKTYDNESIMRRMLESQGFTIAEDNSLTLPDVETNGSVPISMEIPEELVPKCPVCGEEMTTNLRVDSAFVQDDGWNVAAQNYSDFAKTHLNTKTLYLELGVGMNTPGIIKYPFWNSVYQNPQAIYACINKGEAYPPQEIVDRSICINDDIDDVLQKCLLHCGPSSATDI